MIPLSTWYDTGDYFTYGEHQIFTQSAGLPHRPTLLLIHGYPSASWDWEALWPILSEQYHVLTLDMLGFGWSDKPQNTQYLITQQADIYQAFLQHKHVSEYHILSHDYGDTVAQELLARQILDDDTHAPNIRSVCFLNGGLFPEVHRPLLIQTLLRSPLGKFITKLITKRSFTKNMRHIFGEKTPPSDALIDGLWTLLEYNNGLNIMPQLIDYIAQRQQHRTRWVSAMQRANIPLKLIIGCVDPISGEHMAQRYQTIIPNADIHRLHTIGHYPQIEAPNGVLNAYLSFLDNTSRR